MATTTARRRRITSQDLVDFSGGLNLRDAPTELAPNETPSAMNVTFDERGGVVKRLGMTKWNAAAADALITYSYYSQVADKLLHYAKSNGKLWSDPGTGVFTLARTWTAASRISIVDFAGKVYAIHPVDGLYSSTDGVTWAAVVAASGSVPKGDLLANWQNKLWPSGDPNQTNRLYFCAAGDPTKWASVDGGGSNDIREKDDAGIVALQGAAGFDAQTKPALLVGKSESLYRVYDSSTGAYQTLDQSTGPASAKCMVSRYGFVYILSKHGVFKTDGFSPCVPVSSKLDPQFTDDGLAYSLTENFCAGYKGDRLYFSVARAGASANDFALEYHPLQGWFSAATNAAAAYVVYGKNAETLIAASPATTGQLYKLNNGGSDDGAAIKSWFLTRIFEPNAGYQARLQVVRTLGRGAFTLAVLIDFSAGRSAEHVVEVSTPGGAWDLDGWDDPTTGWGDTVPEGWDPWESGLVGRAFQFRVDETSSTSSTGLKLLETGPALPIGAWALYGLLCQFTPLGLS